MSNTPDNAVKLPPDWQLMRVTAALSESVDWSHGFLGLTPEWYKADVSKIRVGVLDTGCATKHPDLRDVLFNAVDCTNSPSGPEDVAGHGSWCCGAIGAATNDIGVRGIASGCQLYSIKVLGDQGWGDDRTIAAGLRLAIDFDLDVISMSLGGPNMSEEVLELLRAFVRMKPRRFIFAAAGNDGKNTRVNYPARWAETQAIAAVDKDGNLTSFSSYEPDIVACAAPGYQMLSTIPGGYGLMSGTSMAAPTAAGVGAKILAKHANAGGATPVDTPQEMREHLRKTAKQKGDLFLLNPMGMFNFEPPPPVLPPPPPTQVWEKTLGIGSTKHYEYAVCRRRLSA